MFESGSGPVPDGASSSDELACVEWEGPFDPPSAEQVAADEAEQVA